MSRLTVVVTGATKGLGRATTLAFARAGHLVIGLYSADTAAAKGLEAELLLFGGSSIVVKHDVRMENDDLWSRAEIREAENLVLVNNACGAFVPQPFHLLSWDDVEGNLSVALKGSWLCSRALLRPMVRRGRGTIVNVLTAALHGLPPKGFAAYAVAKHAVRGMTLALAAEYASKGVRVFSVSPGFMSTSLTAGWDDRFVRAAEAQAPATDPARAAERIRELVEGLEIAGQGEDYKI